MANFNRHLLIPLLFLCACATPPTITDVEETSSDTSIVFGSLKVFEEGDEVEWGTRFFGHDYFYLLILPPDSNEAISYKVAKDGNFYWTLEPGEHLLLGYVWDSDSGQRTGHLGASFDVPTPGTDAYIGSIIIRGNMVFLIPSLEDDFDAAVVSYRRKFPGRQENVIKRLIEEPQQLGAYEAVRGPCHDSWNINCTDRFKGVTPISPEVSQSGFPIEDRLIPEFRWRGCPRADVSYDLILYEAAAYSVAGQLAPSYVRGRVVAYVENLDEPRWQPDMPLKADTRYIWSVRLREDETVSFWSTQSHFTFLLVYMSSGHGQWFQFQTATSKEG